MAYHNLLEKSWFWGTLGIDMSLLWKSLPANILQFFVPTQGKNVLGLEVGELSLVSYKSYTYTQRY